MADNKLKAEDNKDMEKESDTGSESETEDTVKDKKGAGDKNKKKNAASAPAAKIKPPAKKRVKAEQTDENKKEKEKDAKKKKVAVKVKEEEDDDDEGSDGEENGVPEKVPLLDQPLEVSGSRERKQVQRFIPKENLKTDADKKVEIPDGKGTPLGDIPAIEYQISKSKVDNLKILHRVLFNRVGQLHSIKNNILQFKGFDFDKDKDSSGYKKKLTIIAKLKNNALKALCTVLDLTKTGKNYELAEKVLDFLVLPQDSGREAPDPRPKRKGIKNKSYKEPKGDGDEGDQSKKGKSKTSPAKKKNKGSSDEEDQEEEEEESDEKRTDDENDEENETAESEEDKPKKAKKRGAPAKKAVTNSAPAGKKAVASSGTGGGGGNNKRGKEPKSESETENQSDSEETAKDPPAKKSKNPPTDDEIKSYVKSVLEAANLEEITMKTVCKKVYEHYPDFDLGYKKEFIKNTVKSLISS